LGSQKSKHANLLTVADLSGPYKIADFDEKPMVMELTGEINSVEFWSQGQAIDELRRQVASRIGGGRGSMLQSQTPTSSSLAQVSKD